MKDAMPQASLRRICRVLDVTRSTLYEAEAAQAAAGESRQSSEPSRDELLIARIKALIEAFPTYGCRRICALLRKRDKLTINRKQVYRLMRDQRWLISQREVSPKPRVQKSRSRTERSNERWAMDISHVYCGADGWGHLVAVIDCHDRELVGWEFALRGRAQEAERALEMACLARFGTLRPTIDRATAPLLARPRRSRARRRHKKASEWFDFWGALQHGNGTTDGPCNQWPCN